MPRNIRNWWIELTVDGKKTVVETGPRSKDGGFRLKVYQRGAPNACERPVLTLDGYAKTDGTLVLTVDDCARPHDLATGVPTVVLTTKR